MTGTIILRGGSKMFVTTDVKKIIASQNHAIKFLEYGQFHLQTNDEINELINSGCYWSHTYQSWFN